MLPEAQQRFSFESSAGNVGGTEHIGLQVQCLAGEGRDRPFTGIFTATQLYERPGRGLFQTGPYFYHPLSKHLIGGRLVAWRRQRLYQPAQAFVQVWCTSQIVQDPLIDAQWAR